MCRIMECVFTDMVTSRSPSRTCHIRDLSVEMLSVEIISRHLNWQVYSLKLLLTAYNTYSINTNNFFLQGVPVVNENSPAKSPRK